MVPSLYDLEIRTSSGAGFWTHPVHTQERDGPLIYQGTVVTPFWDVTIPAGASWGTVVTWKFLLGEVPQSGLYQAV